jgi:cell division protein FtsI/penicillin-binding protein 2
MAGPTCASPSRSRSTPTTTSWRWTWASSASTITWSYGFGQPTGIDLTGEIGGILPSPAYKRKTRKEAWYPGDTVNISIGQGDWKVTPLQLARASRRLADGSCAPRTW